MENEGDDWRNPAPSLPEGHKACLRLVAQGMSSKEIARTTGLAPLTVDTYLKQAIARLGVSNRREAARRLLEIEGSQKSGSPSPELAPAGPGPAVNLEAGMKGWRHWVRLPPVGGGLHDLTWSQKSFQVLHVAVSAAVVLLALSLAIAGLFQILR
jgi:hypothetical protein